MCKEYCSRCEKQTGTVFNEFMVGFCAECKTVRRYVLTVEKRAFKCDRCGRLMDEVFVGQSVCLDCENAWLNE